MHTASRRGPRAIGLCIMPNALAKQYDWLEWRGGERGEGEGNDRRRLSVVVDDSRDFMIRDISREEEGVRRRRRGGIGNEPIVTRRFRTVAYSRELLRSSQRERDSLSHWRVALLRRAIERERERCWRTATLSWPLIGPARL